MAAPKNNLRISAVLSSDVDLQIRDFLIDREARGLSPRTVTWYREKLSLLQAYLHKEGIAEVCDLAAGLLRRYLLYLAEGHSPGGVHGAYRALRAFLNWWELETEPEHWSCPLRWVRPPKVAQEPLEPVDLDDLRAMLATCRRGTFNGDRDRAMLMFLLDSGCRRAEFCALDVGHVDLATGSVLVTRGKGGKTRVTFIGAKTRRALTRYLRYRPGAETQDPLWATQEGGRLSYAGLREVIRRVASRAGVPEPSPHAFRRGFALAALRGGCDLVTLQRLLGHSSLAVVGRYLKLDEQDLQAAHGLAGPVDRVL